MLDGVEPPVELESKTGSDQLVDELDLEWLDGSWLDDARVAYCQSRSELHCDPSAVLRMEIAFAELVPSSK